MFKVLIPDWTKFYCQSSKYRRTIFWKARLRCAYLGLISSKLYLPHTNKILNNTSTTLRPAATRGKCQKGILKLKEKDNATFFLLSDVWCLPSSTKPGERQRVADCGASMNMLSRKDLIAAELETVRVSRNPQTVLAANGKAQTNEDATVCVNDLDLFVTVQIFEDTPTVLSLGKLFEDHGYSYEWTSGQKTHLIENGRKYNATMRITNLTLFRACQPDFPACLRLHPQHRYRRTQCEMIQRQVQQTHEVGVNAVGHWETSFTIGKNPKNRNKMRTSIEYRDARCVICRDGSMII